MKVICDIDLSTLCCVLSTGLTCNAHRITGDHSQFHYNELEMKRQGLACISNKASRSIKVYGQRYC